MKTNLLKKVTLFAFCALSIALSSCSCDNMNYPPRIITDLESDDLRGNVEFVICEGVLKTEYNKQGWCTKTYGIGVQNGQKEFILKSENYFDEDGCTQIGHDFYEFSWDGTCKKRSSQDTITVQKKMGYLYNDRNTQYKFNKAGYLIEKIKTQESSMQNKQTINKYQYNDNNKISEILTSGYEEDVYETSNTYGEYIICYEERDVYTYNDHGDAISIKTLYEDGKILREYKFDYKYDKKGNWIEKKAWNGSLTRAIEYYE